MDKVKARNRAYYLEHRERILEQVKEYRTRNLTKARAASNRRNKERWRELKQAVLTKFGGVCECCGETGFEFLTVDHINNDGNEHRRQIKAAFGIYGWLEKNGFPKDGLQLLCWNCNMGKRANGGTCPHQALEGSTTIAQASTPERAEARGTER